MSSETTAGWTGDVTTSNLTDLLDNSTAADNKTLGAGGQANAILAEDTIKIIYLIIGEFNCYHRGGFRHFSRLSGRVNRLNPSPAP